MIVPTRRLAYVLAAGAVVAAALTEASGSGLAWWMSVVAVSATILLLGVVDGLAAGNKGSLEVERLAPSVVVTGASAELGWRWHNTSEREMVLAFADELAPSLRAVRRGQVTIPARGRTTSTTTMQPQRRGRFEPETLVIRLRGPLGVAARQHTRQVSSTIRVVPPFRSRAAVELRLDQSRLLESGMRSSRSRGGGTEFAQLREYVVGDDYRRVDWGATGRLGRPIMREYSAEQHQNVFVMVDNGRVMAGRIGDVPRVEFAMDAAMAVSAATMRIRDRVGLMAFDRRVRSQVAHGAGRSQQEAIVNALFDLEPELSESDYLGAFTHALRRHRRRSLFIVLTELVEPVVIDSLAPALAALTGKHQVIVAAVRDPKLERQAASTRLLTTHTLPQPLSTHYRHGRERRRWWNGWER
jgi:uncharacterized protein (DUF58 family)